MPCADPAQEFAVFACLLALSRCEFGKLSREVGRGVSVRGTVNIKQHHAQYHSPARVDPAWEIRVNLIGRFSAI